MRTVHRNRSFVLAGASAYLLTGVLSCAVSPAPHAQTVAPTYQADPDIYKVLFEDVNFRVILATWKKGAHDKPHSHLVPSAAYYLTDCKVRIHLPDGKTVDLANKAGTAAAIPVVASHSAENIGSDCQIVFVERN